ncbi:MAG: hypothetical protein U9O94_04985 [Nanoarchaeota archaeon]|nr:hypothetical protein [Nanoarchaeota archaeon]
MRKDITTIKISKKVIEELSKLKIHPRQAYEEVIVKLLECYKEGQCGGEKVGRGGFITTIKVSKQTVEELSKLKIHPRQAYEEVVVSLLEIQKKQENG